MENSIGAVYDLSYKASEAIANIKIVLSPCSRTCLNAQHGRDNSAEDILEYIFLTVSRK